MLTLLGSAPHLIPFLLDSLSKKEEWNDSEDWTVSKAALCCLNIVTDLLPDTSVMPLILPFVKQNIRSEVVIALIRN